MNKSIRKQIAEILKNEDYFLFASVKGVSVSKDERLIIINDKNRESIKFDVEKQTYHHKFSLFPLLSDYFFYSKVKKIEKLLKEEGYQMEVFENEIRFKKGESNES